MRRTLAIRARIIGAFFIITAVFLIGRLYFLQVVHGEDYRRQAVSQYVEPDPDTESRGSIFFTMKDGQSASAAVMQTGWRIAIRPADIVEAKSAYETLSALTDVDDARFFTSVAKVDDPYEEVAFRVSDDAAAQIRKLKIPGVILVSDQWRFYPAHELAAQTIGFVGYQGDRKVGVYGLEKRWQDTLADTSRGVYVNPFAEIFTSVAALVAPDPASHEGSIITSIEPNVQRELEATLDVVMKTYTPKLVGGIVMDPMTGEIAAIAGRPAFDPNTYNTVSDPSLFTNALVEGRYEMGSIMKPLTMAAAIDIGAVTPDTTYNDKGCITRSNKKICNYDLKARGVVPMQEILSQSLNLGATFLVDTMGHDTFTRYMEAYQLDQKTGIDLPDEVSGDLSTLGNGSGPEVNYATASFGQGLAVSPIEMTRALAALASGGVLPNPHVVTGIKYESGITRSIHPGEGARVISTTTAETVTDMLIQVYDDSLLDGVLKMEHYSVAAKTGTAQIPDPATGTYYTDRYLHSFFGYFPAYEPRYIIFLFVLEPHGVEYASASLARPFHRIMQYVVNYYGIPPDR
ncbi:MAG: penicillin-binding protein 2 [Patescibacteria group bacterium]|nr:penicillin-binding protein 2 [Patescibacteria group bacterium]